MTLAHNPFRHFGIDLSCKLDKACIDIRIPLISRLNKTDQSVCSVRPDLDRGKTV